MLISLKLVSCSRVSVFLELTDLSYIERTTITSIYDDYTVSIYGGDETDSACVIQTSHELTVVSDNSVNNVICQ